MRRYKVWITTELILKQIRKASLEEIFNEIDEFRSYHIKVRARFPKIGESQIGQTVIQLPEFFQKSGINFELRFNSALTEESRKENNDIGHFINQNFVLRLYAILNYYEFLGESVSLNKDSPGFIEVEIVRRLRNIYAHSLGRYNEQDSGHRKLRDLLFDRFNVDAKEYLEFPLNINRVLTPLIVGCKEYIKHNY